MGVAHGPSLPDYQVNVSTNPNMIFSYSDKPIERDYYKILHCTALYLLENYENAMK